MNRDLFHAVKAVKEHADHLGGEEKRLLDKMMFEFERSGLSLDDKDFNELAQLKKKLGDLCIKYSTNMNEDKTTITFTKEELEGCQEDFVNGLEKTQDGKFIVTMKYPDLVGVLKYAKKDSTRKALDFQNGSRLRGNIGILEEAVLIRKKCATLLKYQSFPLLNGRPCRVSTSGNYGSCP